MSHSSDSKGHLLTARAARTLPSRGPLRRLVGDPTTRRILPLILALLLAITAVGVVAIKAEAAETAAISATRG
jgi:hypothetical protein